MVILCCPRIECQGMTKSLPSTERRKNSILHTKLSLSCKFHAVVELHLLSARCIFSTPGRDLDLKLQDLFHLNAIMRHLSHKYPQNETIIYHLALTEHLSSADIHESVMPRGGWMIKCPIRENRLTWQTS